MNSNASSRSGLRAVLIALLVVAASHMQTGTTAQAEQPKPPPSDASNRGGFQSPAVPIKRLPPVASKGGCEPRYRNGMVGTCVNAKPCRGFGVRGDDGTAQCECYIRRGGCNADERCSAEEGQCVADDESEFNREH
jgi:hypothetical protein